MTTLQYKAVFSDLDGTFLNSEGRVSEANKRALEYLYNMGVAFVPATGRQVRSLPDDILKNPHIRYCITSNGVEIYDLKEKKTVSKLYMPENIVDRFFDLCEELGNPAVEVYYKSAAYITKEYFEDPAKFNNPRVDYIQSTRTVVSDLRAFAKEHENELDGLTIIAPDGMLNTFANRVKDSFPELYVTTADGIYVETSNANCGKHRALLRVCALLGITTSEAIAFGDQENDLDMLNAAGLSIAVANATPNLQNAADYITGTNDDNGVAESIREIFS